MNERHCRYETETDDNLSSNITQMHPNIDVGFDFTTDTPGFWDGFWEKKGGLGYCGNDPDSMSKVLRRYHSILWSRELPNGEVMKLEECGDHLSWNSMRFASDSITATFRYERCRSLIDSVAYTMEDYRRWMEHHIRSMYTIGGMIIFPKHWDSINQIRGRNQKISDRWDLTLECIRRYYDGESSPMTDCLKSDREFFDLFIDFRGYVDYFLLQDCVDEDYNVKLWMDTELWVDNPLPKDVDQYLAWIDCNEDFVERRNGRISKLVNDIDIPEPGKTYVQTRF